MDSSIGIIGGADGPTRIFVTGGTGTIWLAAAAVLIGAVVLLVFLRKRRKK